MASTFWRFVGAGMLAGLAAWPATGQAQLGGVTSTVTDTTGTVTNTTGTVTGTVTGPTGTVTGTTDTLTSTGTLSPGSSQATGATAVVNG